MIRLSGRFVLLAALAIVLGLGWVKRGQGMPSRTVRIVAAETDAPVAATVVVTDGAGKPIEPAGAHGHVEYLGKRRCYVDGVFSVSPGKGPISVELRRGMETRPLTTTLAEGTGEITLRMARWIDMKQLGYLSGDTHIHFLSGVDAHAQMRAEDVNVANVLLTDITRGAVEFTGKLDPASTEGAWVYTGQEVRDWQLGHVVLMRIRELVQPVGPAGGALHGPAAPNRLMARALLEGRRLGGVASWAHFTNLPGMESPVDVALGLLDSIDLITFSDPTMLPAHLDPWDLSGFPVAEFPPLRGMDLYAQFLNAGFRIPLGAGSDKMGENVPVGYNRLYAQVDPGARAPTYDDWLAALKAGRGFVTNAPMLTFTVDGHSSGDVVSFEGTRRVTVNASARSLLPFTGLEIVVNGQVVQKKTIPHSQAHIVDGIQTEELQASIDLHASSWIAARVAENPDLRNPILPRGLTVFAHSNPVYFLRHGAPVRETASIQYLIKWIDGYRHWLKTATFVTQAEKREAIELADKARAHYAALLRRRST